MLTNVNMTEALRAARHKAREVAASGKPYDDFVSLVREVYPWRFERLSREALDRDYLRVVDHHLEHLVPRMSRYLGPQVRRVLDFGCGSGGSAIALALACPKITCVGADIDDQEVMMARERSKLYGLEKRCQFHCVPAGEALPLLDGSFDLCVCSSVLEYAVDPDVRRFCIHEMTRLLRPEGLLVCSVPNRLYPFEIHTMKWGWNQFPRLLNATTVDCTAWEVKRLARPRVLRLHRTPLLELFRPWSTFCLRREPDPS